MDGHLGRGYAHAVSPTLLTAALVVSLGLTACGGSKQLTHQEFVTKANADCRRANTRVAALAPPPRTLQGLATYANRFGPIAKQLVADLDQLDPPKADRATFDRYRSALRGNVDRLETLRQAALDGDAQRVGQVADAIAAHPTDSAATSLGLEACAQHPTPGAA